MATSLKQIVDRQEIVDITVRYCTALDGRDWDLLRTCFAVDARADFGPWGVANGIDEIVGSAAPVMEGMDHTQHIVANHQVELEGDTAIARCALVAEHLLVSDIGATTSTTRGAYEDRFVRTAHGWRISHRSLVVWWREGNTGIFDLAMARLTKQTNGDGR